MTVPTNWQDPSGDPAANQYGNAFKASEKMTAPGSPPLFMPASMNKYHTDTQKMHIAKIGSFIDDDVLGDLLGVEQLAVERATMAGIMINGPVAAGGTLVGPPLTAARSWRRRAVSTPNRDEVLQRDRDRDLDGVDAVHVDRDRPRPAVVPRVRGGPLAGGAADAEHAACPFAALTQVPVSISARRR